MNSPMKRLRILVIEDEALVAMFVEDMLIDIGHDVGAVASRMQDALDVAQNGIFDWAILDVNLDGQTSYPVADILKERGVPFAFATGYGSRGLDTKYAYAPVLAKPFVRADLEKLLQQVTEAPLLPTARTAI
jgi:CheY-like chemotaxis protein